jgi:hypothetical protein
MEILAIIMQYAKLSLILPNYTPEMDAQLSAFQQAEKTNEYLESTSNLASLVTWHLWRKYVFFQGLLKLRVNLFEFDMMILDDNVKKSNKIALKMMLLLAYQYVDQIISKLFFEIQMKKLVQQIKPSASPSNDQHTEDEREEWLLKSPYQVSERWRINGSTRW